MKRTRKLLAMLALGIITAAGGQLPQHITFGHPLTASIAGTGLKHAAANPDTLVRVLAVMVDFQTDNDARTTGNGHFDLTSAPAKIDGGPHDAAYFRNHLAFLHNYFARTSHGILNVRPTLLDSVFHLPKQMRLYSSLRTSTTNAELGRLVLDTWTTVDSVMRQAGQPVAFDQYDVFLIFHAGVGRDVDVLSASLYDPTPYDIPSLYMNLPGLRKALDNATYAGVPVAGNSFMITNSMIIPETDSRSINDVPIELGINGLLAANLGSYLGLPDLFDTKSGASGIGRFGLMDGQSIFSWYGVFPPAPSAWERMHLGWCTPVEVRAGDSTFRLPAIGLGGTDTVYKVPISEKEYFLLENRNRDANRDGATVTMVVNGGTVVKHWNHDTTGFNFTSQDSLAGSIVDIDEYDWSLPGFVDAGTKEFYDGGILIWHIDETIIDATIGSDAVNADENHRGVNLMEADGSQDIGQSYAAFTSAGSGSEDGTPLDFWYRGNISPMRRLFEPNAFTPTSHPGSLSNAGANSHIRIGNSSIPDTTGISFRGPHMTVRIILGDDQVRFMPGFPKPTGSRFGSNPVCITDSLGSIVIATRPVTQAIPSTSGMYGAVYGWQANGSVLFPGGEESGLLASFGGSLPGRYIGKAGIGNFGVSSVPGFVLGYQALRDFFPPEEGPIVNGVTALDFRDQNSDHRADVLFSVAGFREITTSPVVSDSFVAVGAKGGLVYRFRLDGTLADSTTLGSGSDTVSVTCLGLYRQPASYIAVLSDGSWGICGTFAVCGGAAAGVQTPAVSGLAAAFAVSGQISEAIGHRIIVVSRSGDVASFNDETCIDRFRTVGGFRYRTGDAISNAPAIADIDGDGQKDIVVFSGNRIYVLNAAGSPLDHFPITVATSNPILTSPVIADLDGDGRPDVVAITQEGLVVAYDRNGAMLRGFPLLTGTNSGATPAAFRSGTALGLSAASDDGYVYSWKTGTLAAGSAWSNPWPQFQHDAQNTGMIQANTIYKPIVADFMPGSRVYNWPNPVTSSDHFLTHIRYYVASNATVTIKIYDMAGDLVTDFGGKTFDAAGGLDQEVDWNVSGIQSGVYFAHVAASGSGGSGTAIIKIAVIK